MMTPVRIWKQVRNYWSELLHLNQILAFDWKSERPLLSAGITSLLVEIVARLLEPWPLKFIIDDVIDSSQGDLPSQLEAISPHALIAWGGVAVVMIAALRAGSQYVSTISLAVVGNRFLTTLRTRTFNHIQHLPIQFHDSVRSGDLVTRLVSDMGRLQEIGVTALLPMVVHTLTLVFMLILMLVINLQLGLMSLCVIPLFWLGIARSGGRIRSVSRDQRKREGKLGAASTEAISAIRTVQAMGLEQAMSASFDTQNRKSANQSVRGKRLAAKLERSVDLLIALATALVLWRGALLVIDRVLTPGDLLVFLAYLKNAFKPMRDMAKYSGRISSALASAERIVEILETPTYKTDGEQSAEAPKEIRSLRFSDVSFSYHNHSQALTEISFEARPGELIALVGPSGAGKSTLMNLLVRLYEPSSGGIYFDDQNIRAYGVRSLRSRIAIVPQESILFNMSIRDNIAIGCTDLSSAEIQQAAQLAGAHEFIQRMEQGYDTVISERGTTLSGGQQRRLAIARAAVRDTPILILDEPMAGLDLHNRKVISEALHKLRKNKIIFMIVHDASSAIAADQIVMLKQGRIVDKGNPLDLVEQQGSFARFMLATHPHGDANQRV